VPKTYRVRRLVRVHRLALGLARHEQFEGKGVAVHLQRLPAPRRLVRVLERPLLRHAFFGGRTGCGDGDDTDERGVEEEREPGHHWECLSFDEVRRLCECLVVCVDTPCVYQTGWCSAIRLVKILEMVERKKFAILDVRVGKEVQ
jgi:hypothetical protein